MKDLGFPRSARLLLGQEYRSTMSQRCRSDDRLFSVYAAGGRLDRARLGITVSRRVSTRAVDRNRLKRLVRESFRYHRYSLLGLDLVVIARHDAVDTKKTDIDQSLSGHWNRLKEKCAKG